MMVVVTLLVHALLILYHQSGLFFLKRALRESRFQVHECLYQLGYEQGQRKHWPKLSSLVLLQ
jgi:hypothetical protein